MKTALLLSLLIPSLANSCDGYEKFIIKKIAEKSVTASYINKQLIVTCDTKKLGVHECNHVFEYYRRHRKFAKP